MFLKSKQKGFALLELMTVLLIIGIIVLIAVPIYRDSLQEKAMVQADAANLRTINSAVTQYLANHPGVNAIDIDIDPGPGVLSDYIQNWPTSPGTYTVVNGQAVSTYP